MIIIVDKKGFKCMGKKQIRSPFFFKNVLGYSGPIPY